MLKKYSSNRSVLLWNTRSLCIGPSASLLKRHYGVPALHVGIFEPFELHVADRTHRSWCALVPANIPHIVNFDGGIHAKLFVERNSIDYAHMLNRFPHKKQQVTTFEDPDTINTFRWIYEENPGKEVIEAAIDQLLNCNHHNVSYEIDNRIQKAINIITEQSDKNLSQEYLASQVNLSSSRFLHLFKEQTAVSYRHFRTWKRLQQTMKNLYATDNMTHSAIAAGFSDASHFSRCFRETYGVSPSLVFRNVTRFETT